MKKNSRNRWSVFVFGILTVLSISAQAQNASLQWNLMSDNAVTTVVGTVAGQSENLSHSASTSDSALCLYVKDYAASGGGGQRLNLGAKTWPNQSVIDTGRYVQFAIQPTAGYSLQVSSVSMTIGAGGTSSMRAAIYYSTNPMFNGSTVLVSSLTLPNGGWYDSTLTAFTVSTSLNALQTLYVRVYPWYNSSNASTSKYLYLRNVKIAGTTYIISSAPTVITALASSVTASSAVCGGTVVSAGSDSVTVRGVCWNTRGTPTILDPKTIDGAGIGTFTSNLSGLEKDTTYYVRAYATNSTGTSYGSEQTFVAADPPPQLPAFPGAEGFGKYTVGGRGGRVIEVTSLEDATTEGTLRYAVNQSGPRTVVFRVSGTITLTSPLTISNPYITIAGQTAPGDGITLRDYTVQVSAYNVILRYMRFRMGDAAAYEGDALGGRNTNHVIIDHCSVSWSTDECSSFYDNQLFTLQWCIITESLRISIHAKGTHGYGGIWGGQNASFHHNLLAHHDSRNPRFCGSRYSNRADLELVDFRNNVIYNWGANSGYAGEGGRYNMVNNYYKPGPATKSGVKTRIFQPNADDGLNSQPAGVWGTFYVAGNFMAGSTAVTNDNWQGMFPNPSTKSKSELRSDSAFTTGYVTTHSAEEAYALVLDQAGASIQRDAVDTRIVHEVKDSVFTFTGINGSTGGLIDTQGDVGGWPVLTSTTPPVDTDKDGMPDAWESAMGLNPNDAADRNAISTSGYTYLEVYLNSVDLLEPTSVAASSRIPTTFILSQNYPNPFNPTTSITYSIPQRGVVSLMVYDVLGRLVSTLVNESKAGGTYTVSFNADRLSSGIYFYRLSANLEGTNAKAITLAKKMMLIK